MIEQGYTLQNAGAQPVPNYVPRMVNQNYAAPGMERAQPVLGNQPPLPREAAMRLIQIEEQGHEGILVPISHYGEEDHTSSSNQVPFPMEAMDPEGIVLEGSYQMDHKTLWFIANRGAQPRGGPGPRPYRAGPPQGAPPRPCYGCGGEHWIKDFPKPKGKTTS